MKFLFIPKCGMKLSFIPKLQRLHHRSLGMDKPFHSTLHWACDYLIHVITWSMLELKLIHVSKKGPRISTGLRFNLIWIWIFLTHCRPSDVTWWHWSGSTLTQIMAHCLEAPLPESMLTYHKMCSLAFTREQSHKKCSCSWSVTSVWRLPCKNHYHFSQGPMNWIHRLIDIEARGPSQ